MSESTSNLIASMRSGEGDQEKFLDNSYLVASATKSGTVKVWSMLDYEG
jgi:hypothetical protein